MIKDILKWEPAKVNRGYVKNIFSKNLNMYIVLNDSFKEHVLKGKSEKDIIISCENYSSKTLFKSTRTYLNEQNNIEVELPFKDIDRSNLKYDVAYPFFAHIENNKIKLPIEKDVELPIIFDETKNDYVEFLITKYNKLRIKKVKGKERVLINDIQVEMDSLSLQLTLFLPVLYSEIQKNLKNYLLEIKLESHKKIDTVLIEMDKVIFNKNFTAEISTIVPVSKLDSMHNLSFSLINKHNKNKLKNLMIDLEENVNFTDETIIIKDEVYIIETITNNSNDYQYKLKIRKKVLEPRVDLIKITASNILNVSIKIAGYNNKIEQDFNHNVTLLFIERQTKATIEYSATYNNIDETIEINIDEERTLANHYFTTGVWDAYLRNGDRTFRVSNPRKHGISNYIAYNYPQIVISDGNDHYSLKVYYTFNGYLSLFVRDYVIYKNVRSISINDKKLCIYGHVNIMKPNKGRSGKYKGIIKVPLPYEEDLYLNITIELQKTELNHIEYAYAIESDTVLDDTMIENIFVAKNFDNWIVSSISDTFKFVFPIVIHKDLKIETNKKLNKIFLSKLDKFMDKFKIPAYKLFSKVFSIKKNTYMFQSFYGNSYADNPRAIYEKLFSLEGNNNRYIWVLKDKGLFAGEHATIVKPMTWKYFYYLARSENFINNANFPDFFIKRKKSYFMQTWHGTPLKKLGLDVSKNTQAFSANSDENLIKRTRSWDLLISPNTYTSEIMKSAYELNIPIKTIGYPRNDQLIQTDMKRIDEIKRFLKIPFHKKVILYAPTWREDDDKRENYRLRFNINKFYKNLKDDYVLLLRLHYFDAQRMQLKEYSDFIYNVTNYNDIGDLYNIADILITDYSSVMFDYSITNNPILFYQYDYEKYKDKLRGFYVDFESIAPGPILKNSDQLLNAIINLPDIQRRYENKYEEFREKFNSFEKGDSSLKAIKELKLLKGNGQNE